MPRYEDRPPIMYGSWDKKAAARQAHEREIVVRVLDRDAEEKLARIISTALTGGFPSGPKSIDHQAARAVLAYLRGAQ